LALYNEQEAGEKKEIGKGLRSSAEQEFRSAGVQ
jgi:hypothetical protein